MNGIPHSVPHLPPAEVTRPGPALPIPDASSYGHPSKSWMAEFGNEIAFLGIFLLLLFTMYYLYWSTRSMSDDLKRRQVRVARSFGLDGADIPSGRPIHTVHPPRDGSEEDV
jgi:hypothetical protein